MDKAKLNQGSMTQFAIVTVFAVTLSAGIAAEAEEPPNWAYGTQPAVATATHGTQSAQTSPGSSLKHLSGSAFAFTPSQISDRFGPADWYPGDHTPMPDVVAHGRKPAVWACSLCHYPNGKGRPENAGISGLPVTYFIQQMNEFKDGLRKSA